MSQVIINDVPPYTQAIATMGQTVFSTTWTANFASDVIVYYTPDGTPPDDYTQILAYPADYSVAFIGDQQQVQVTLVTPAAANGDIVTITRQTPADRVNLYSNTNFLPTMLNNDFGILTLVDQQAQLVDQFIAPRYNYSATINGNVYGGTVDSILPILPANETWVKNNGNTAITTYFLPPGGVAPAQDTYVLLTADLTNLPNALGLNTLPSGFMVNDVLGNTILTEAFSGTANQISILNADGTSGSPVISISSNPIMPGTAGMGIPSGTTAQRVTPGSNISLRFNTTTQSIEYYNGAWIELIDDVVVNPGLINQLAWYEATGASVSGLPTANNGVLITSSGGVPSIYSTLPIAVQTNITELGIQAQALNMGSFQINALADPTHTQDAVTVNAIQQQQTIYAVDTGTANSYLIAPMPAISTFVDGQLFNMKALHTNTGSSVIHVNGQGPLSILTNDANFTLANMILADGNYLLQFNVTLGAMILLNPSIGVGNVFSIAGDTGEATESGGIITLTGSTTGLTFAGASSTVTLGGTLAISNGGTGKTSVTVAPAATSWAGWDANKNLSAVNHIQGYTTTATAAMTTTLVVGSTYQQFFTGTTTQTVLMPVTSTLVLGQSWYIVNNSTGVVTVQSSGSNTIIAMAANSTALVTCILTSGTTAASWYADYVNAGVTLPLSLADGGTNNALTASAGGIVWSDSTKLNILSGTSTASQILLSGNAATPSWSTSTYPSSNAANTLLYASSANTMAALATANSCVLVTSSGGVPSLSTTLPAALTIPQPSITGVTNGSSAAAGEVGEYISSQVLFASAINIPNATATDITHISLTAGDWDVGGNILMFSTLLASTFIGWVSTSSATFPDASLQSGIVMPATANGNTGPGALNTIRVNVSTTTNVYLTGYCGFSSGTVTGCGYIWARRVR